MRTRHTVCFVVALVMLAGCASGRRRVPEAGTEIKDIDFRDGKISITVSGQTNKAYQLQQTTRLENPCWTSVGTVVTSESGQVILTDTNASGPCRYYRVITVPPNP